MYVYINIGVYVRECKFQGNVFFFPFLAYIMLSFGGTVLSSLAMLLES